jgi:hypothetical protein
MNDNNTAATIPNDHPSNNSTIWTKGPNHYPPS